MKIKNIKGREILDSRGQPTVECVLTLDNGCIVSASVPSGASVGKYEAKELRDGDQKRFVGKGVLKAIKNLETVIAPMLISKAPDIQCMDRDMLAADGTGDKAKLGANAMLAASIAIIRAQAIVQGVQLFTLINKLWAFEPPTMPDCMFNVINGGMHASSGLDFQEFMVMPQGKYFRDDLEYIATLYAHLKKVIAHQGLSTTVGDEGGFAPRFTDNGIVREHTALKMLMQLMHERTDIKAGLCLDVAASCLYDDQTGMYRLHGQMIDAAGIVDMYEQMAQQYPLVSIEDGLAEDDWDGWKLLTKRLGSKLQLVGDDIFVTNATRIQQGIDNSVANAVLIKPNQIGTVSETMQAIKLCKQAGYKIVISHRSGETNDSFIADLAVGAAADYLKAGAPARGERVAKYNRLLEIEGLL